MALIATTFATPASAHELDEDKIAAKICGPGASTDGSDYGDSDDDGDLATVDVYAYDIGEDAEGDPVSLCIFAIVSTDEDSKLTGSYTLTGATTAASGAVSGNDFVTTPLIEPYNAGSSVVFDAAGKQLTPKTAKQKKAAKAKHDRAAKAAKTKYAKTVKAAKAKYKKAGKTAKAKAAMTKKIAAAKKKYRAALASASAAEKRRTAPTERSYSLKLNLPFSD